MYVGGPCHLRRRRRSYVASCRHPDRFTSSRRVMFTLLATCWCRRHRSPPSELLTLLTHTTGGVIRHNVDRDVRVHLCKSMKQTLVYQWVATSNCTADEIRESQAFRARPELPETFQTHLERFHPACLVVSWVLGVGCPRKVLCSTVHHRWLDRGTDTPCEVSLRWWKSDVDRTHDADIFTSAHIPVERGRSSSREHTAVW